MDPHQIDQKAEGLLRRSSRSDNDHRDVPEHPPGRGPPGGRSPGTPGGDPGRGPPGQDG